MNKPLVFLQVCIFACLPLSLFGQSSTPAERSGANLGGEGESSVTQTSSSYVISPLDVLRVAVFVADEMQFQREVRVSQSGDITVPYLGNVEIAGMTLEEARSFLYEPYNEDYYVDPQIDLVVLAYSERTVNVIGKVNKQGPIPFPSEQEMYLLEAIAKAGGWSNDRLADMGKVTITRTNEDGEKSIIEVDARKITASDYLLEDGDVVYVPERIW